MWQKLLLDLIVYVWSFKSITHFYSNENDYLPEKPTKERKDTYKRKWWRKMKRQILHRKMKMSQTDNVVVEKENTFLI